MFEFHLHVDFIKDEDQVKGYTVPNMANYIAKINEDLFFYFAPVLMLVNLENLLYFLCLWGLLCPCNFPLKYHECPFKKAYFTN